MAHAPIHEIRTAMAIQYLQDKRLPVTFDNVESVTKSYLLESNFRKLRLAYPNQRAIEAIQIARSDAKRGKESHTRRVDFNRLDHGDVIRTRDASGKRRTFVVALMDDDDKTPPWERHDIHGPVSDWTSRDKRPGERVLLNGSGHRFGNHRFYDIQEATKIARRDGWGLDPDYAWNLAKERKLERPLTNKETAAHAVEMDFKRLQDWCDDRWTYVGVALFELPRNRGYISPKDVADEGANNNLPWWSLWGIESDATDYIQTVISELLDEARNA